MYTLLSIILATILGAILVLIHPLIGGIIAFGIIGGCLFRGVYLISDIHKQLMYHFPKEDRIQTVVDDYIANKR